MPLDPVTAARPKYSLFRRARPRWFMNCLCHAAEIGRRLYFLAVDCVDYRELHEPGHKPFGITALVIVVGLIAQAVPARNVYRKNIYGSSDMNASVELIFC
jgi:hypothetical protein